MTLNLHDVLNEFTKKSANSFVAFTESFFMFTIMVSLSLTFSSIKSTNSGSIKVLTALYALLLCLPIVNIQALFGYLYLNSGNTHQYCSVPKKSSQLNQYSMFWSKEFDEPWHPFLLYAYRSG